MTTPVWREADSALAETRDAASIIGRAILEEDSDKARAYRLQAIASLERAINYLSDPIQPLVIEEGLERDDEDGPSERYERTKLECEYGCDCSIDVNVDTYSGYAFDLETGKYLADLRNQSFVCDVILHGCLAKVLRKNLEWYGHERGYDHPRAKSWSCLECRASLTLDADSVGGSEPFWICGNAPYGKTPHRFRAVLAHQDLEPDGPIWQPDFSQPLV
jgi:hypothetical protein